jgi:hypothetical protein
MTRPKLSMIVFLLLLVAYLRPRNTILASERAAAPPDSICTKAGQFCVNRETSSGVCHVQEATERPQLGTNLAGPFNSRAEGNAGMCRLYEPASGDADKCGAVAPQGICDSK